VADRHEHAASTERPSAPAVTGGAAPAFEALIVLAITLPLAVGLRYPTLWFVVPFALITLSGRPYADYGLTLRSPGSLGFHLRTVAVIFGGYAVLHYAFARWVLGRHLVPALPDDFGSFVLTQLLVVGLSEEFFFRGYLQTQLDRTFERRFHFLGARFGWGLVHAAVLFGLCHLITGDIARLRVIFFGLFAGWLRARTDTIAVPAAYHGCANILYGVLAHSLR
jgi:membrane protease YdiL (CAAX protease family)